MKINVTPATGKQQRNKELARDSDIYIRKDQAVNDKLNTAHTQRATRCTELPVNLIPADAKSDHLLQHIDVHLNRELATLKANTICQPAHGTTQPNTARATGTALSHVSRNLAQVTCVSAKSHIC